MIAGLDSSFAVPTAANADAARAAGVRLWSGYLATKPNVGIAHAWTRTDFESARRCGATPIAYCSGWDDPAACKALAASWNVRLCLDVESSIRGDGPWVQAWLDASGAGLYGNGPVFPNRRAAFFIYAAYPGNDPHATWPNAHPGIPCGWQFQGTHTEFGAGVDRGWYDDFFDAAPVPSTPTPKDEPMLIVNTPVGVYLLSGDAYIPLDNSTVEGSLIDALKQAQGSQPIAWTVDAAQHANNLAACKAAPGPPGPPGQPGSTAPHSHNVPPTSTSVV